MFLTDLSDGDIAVIEKLPDGAGGEKLLALGISSGAEIEKISGSPLGNIVSIAVGEKFYAITNDIAEKLEVRAKQLL